MLVTDEYLLKKKNLIQETDGLRKRKTHHFTAPRAESKVTEAKENNFINSFKEINQSLKTMNL